MARQHRLSVRLIAALGLLGTGCADTLALKPAFDGPLWSDVLQPDEGGPFWTPIGFVANSRGGTVTPLDLRHRTTASDQVGGPFLPPRRVATGDERQLGQVAAWSPADDTVTVFIVDHTHEVLLEAPYVTGTTDLGGGVLEPTVPELTHTEPVFVDADGSGESATVDTIELRYSYTTTEDWTIRFDGGEWTVFGSRSGRQTRSPIPGRVWTSDNRELTFTLRGQATAGDEIQLSTDSGVVEHDLGAVPMSVMQVPDEDLLVVGLWDRESHLGDLALWDPATQSEVGRVALPEDSQPWRLTFDDTGTLYVGDARRSAVYIVDLDTDAPEGSLVEELLTPAGVEAVAVVRQDEDALSQRPGYHHLFVAPVDDNRVDVYDLDAGEWIDVNPRDGIDGGLDLRSPVVGLSTIPVPIKLLEETNAGTRRTERVVAVTTLDGALRLIEAETGCLAIDGQGARLTAEPGAELVLFNDLGDGSTPVLVTNDDTARQVVSSSCGGIARDETWTLVYDGVVGAYRAIGAVSGEQEGLVYEDIRYTTDNGSLSWVVLSGTLPTTDGDSFLFAVEDGVLELSEVVQTTTDIPITFQLPGPPLAFTMEMGPSGGGWDPDRTKAHVLMPVTNSDVVVRVRPQGWSVDHIWN